MARIIGSDEGYINQAIIDNKLSWIHPDSANIIGRKTPVLQFTAASGKQVLISVAEGEFRHSAIDPEAKWRTIIGSSNALILNSPDEKYNCPTAGINGKICIGCGIEKSKISMRAGFVEIKQCNGVYQRALGLKYVANAVVVNFTDRYGERSNEEDLLILRRNNLDTAISNLFSEAERYFADKVDPAMFIIPSIGTGVGRLKKYQFYSVFFEKLQNLVKSRNFNLPNELVLLIWREDIWNRNDTSIAPSISDGIFDLYKERIRPENRRDLSVYYSLIGITGHLLILLGILILGKVRFLESKRLLIQKRGALITIGLIIVAFGVTQSVSNLPFEFLRPSDYFECLVWGIISIPLSIVVATAIKLRDDLAK